MLECHSKFSNCPVLFKEFPSYSSKSKVTRQYEFQCNLAKCCSDNMFGLKTSRILFFLSPVVKCKDEKCKIQIDWNHPRTTEMQFLPAKPVPVFCQLPSENLNPVPPKPNDTALALVADGSELCNHIRIKG